MLCCVALCRHAPRDPPLPWLPGCHPPASCWQYPGHPCRIRAQRCWKRAQRVCAGHTSGWDWMLVPVVVGGLARACNAGWGLAAQPSGCQRPAPPTFKHRPGPPHASAPRLRSQGAAWPPRPTAASWRWRQLAAHSCAWNGRSLHLLTCTLPRSWRWRWPRGAERSFFF